MRSDGTAWERLRQHLCKEAGLDPMSEELAVLQIDDVMTKPIAQRVALYGLFMRHYVDIFNQQDGRCAICKREPSGKYPDILVIDHDHSVTDRNVFRGLLCQPCNRGLGHFGDNIQALEAAIVYLKTPPQITGMTKRQHLKASARKMKRLMETIPQWYPIVPHSQS